MEEELRFPGQAGCASAGHERMRVLLAISHPGVRKALHDLLQSHGRVEVVGALATGATTVDAALALMPDTLLMDLHLPDASGLHVTSHLVRALPFLNVVLLGDEEDVAYSRAARDCGVAVYLPATAPADRLLRAVTLGT